MNANRSLPPAPQASPEDAASRLHAAEAAAAEHLAGWQRARADYENLQKRIAGERVRAHEEGKDDILRSVLPVLDYFEAALASLPPAFRGDAWVTGVRQIHRAFHDALASAGVTVIEDAAVPFDPARHEAVGEEESTAPAGAVAAVLTRGYARNGTVLRPAKVKLSRGRQAASGQSTDREVPSTT